MSHEVLLLSSFEHLLIKSSNKISKRKRKFVYQPLPCATTAAQMIGNNLNYLNMTSTPVAPLICAVHHRVHKAGKTYTVELRYFNQLIERIEKTTDIAWDILTLRDHIEDRQPTPIDEAATHADVCFYFFPGSTWFYVDEDTPEELRDLTDPKALHRRFAINSLVKFFNIKGSKYTQDPEALLKNIYLRLKPKEYQYGQSKPIKMLSDFTAQYWDHTSKVVTFVSNLASVAWMMEYIILPIFDAWNEERLQHRKLKNTSNQVDIQIERVLHFVALYNRTIEFPTVQNMLLAYDCLSPNTRSESV